MKLPYDPTQLPRELKQYYISATEQEINDMKQAIDIKEMSQLYEHINKNLMFDSTPKVSKEWDYHELAEHMHEIANKNNVLSNLIGDGLKTYKIPNAIADISNVRGLTTAYTPYQPERSQGTLMSLWIYSSSLSELTGFEAINASLYERSTCLFEALKTAQKNRKKGTKALIIDSLYPGDKEVLETYVEQTDLEIEFVPFNIETGLADINLIKEKLDDNCFCLVYSQTNNLGLLEDVDALTDFASENNLQSICLFDPKLLSNTGLKRPCEYGSNQQGPNIIIGEGQQLTLQGNFGGPGLGIFGTRYNENDKLSIRNTPGRYVGKAKDLKGKECLAMVLSTREQHIRRDKATSNICSNQSFVATIAGASMLIQGSKGFDEALTQSRESMKYILENILNLDGVNLTYSSPFFNECVLTLNKDVDEIIEKARTNGIQLGINVSERNNKSNQLMLFTNDILKQNELDNVIGFFKDNFNTTENPVTIPSIPENLTVKSKYDLKQFAEDEVLAYYQSLGDMNVSPDDAIYPLGSCTMKYNPHLNDYTAGIAEFTQMHPQANEKDAQGCMQVLYEIQEKFKAITGLPGVTTQPVAGAQGELVGIKLFQAYHKDHGEDRDIILIPRSAHGTNPATATMAGFQTIKTKDKISGIVLIDANDDGLLNYEQLKQCVKEYGKRIAGVMITNPNTSGVFEEDFKKVADLIHSIGAFVYMDGANMNAIAGWVDLGKLGVDAVHNNLHKTWTIPHGGGGPGDAIVAVSEKLIPYLPGRQIKFENGLYTSFKTEKSIGSFHRHWGNFAHKVRALTYIKRLGSEGIKQMAAVAVLSSRYLYNQLKDTYPTLPRNPQRPKMHEFILTLPPDVFTKAQNVGVLKNQLIGRVGKLFLDYGLHAPTVAFPEPYGLMVEPTESFTKSELDHFCDVVKSIFQTINESPQVLNTVPHFTPIDRVDEVGANKNLVLAEKITELRSLGQNRVHPKELMDTPTQKIQEMINEQHAVQQ